MLSILVQAEPRFPVAILFSSSDLYFCLAFEISLLSSLLVMCRSVEDAPSVKAVLFLCKHSFTDSLQILQSSFLLHCRHHVLALEEAENIRRNVGFAQLASCDRCPSAVTIAIDGISFSPASGPVRDVSALRSEPPHVLHGTMRFPVHQLRGLWFGDVPWQCCQASKMHSRSH